MVNSGLQPTQVTYGTLIARAGRWRQPRRAVNLYREMQRRGLEPDIKTCNSLINAFVKSDDQPKDLSKAVAVAASMRKRGLVPTIVTYNTLLDGCARAGNATLAAATLLELQRARLAPTERTFSIMIRLSVTTRKLDAAFRWLAKMEKHGLTPNAFTYSSLIHGCGREGELERAFALLSDMENLGLQPNVVTYTSLVDACARARQPRRALAVWRQMIEVGVQPNHVTCTALFNGCIGCGEVVLAREVLQYMTSVGLRPSAHSFTALLAQASDPAASAEGGASRSAAFACLLRQLVLSEAGRHNDVAFTPLDEAPHVDSAEAVEDAIGNVGGGGGSRTPAAPQEVTAAFNTTQGLRQRLDMLRTLLDAKLSPPTAVWERTFSAVSNGRELSASLELLERARQQLAAAAAGADGEGALGASVFSELLRACARVQQLQPAVSALDQMRELELIPSADAYRELVEACAATRQPEVAVAIFERMKGVGVKPSSAEEYGTLLAAAATRATGVGPTLTPLGSAPQPFLSASESPPAPELRPVFRIFGEMRAAGVQVDRAAFNAMINACARTGDVPRAEGAFSEMVAAGIAPDAISYSSLLKACAVAGDVNCAERIWNEMHQRTNHFHTFTPPTSHAYAHLMAVNRRAGAPERVLGLLAEMRATGLAPTTVHYSLALHACEQHADLPNALARALALYDEMQGAGLRLDSRGLLALGRLANLHGRPDLARRLRRERSQRA